MFTLNNKLSVVAQAIAACTVMLSGASLVEAAETHAGIQELREGDDIFHEIFKDFDFSIVHFYKPSDFNANANKEFFDGVKDLFEQKQDDGTFTTRKVGWFWIDLDNFDNDDGELPVSKETISSHWIMGTLGQRKMLYEEEKLDLSEESKEHFVSVIKELTGDFMTHIDC